MLEGVFEGLITTALVAIISGLIHVYLKVKDLHKWHDVHDEEGVKIWYFRSKNMEHAMNRMVDILDRMDRRAELDTLIQKHQTEVLEKHTIVIDSLVSVCKTLAIEATELRNSLRE